MDFVYITYLMGSDRGRFRCSFRLVRGIFVIILRGQSLQIQLDVESFFCSVFGSGIPLAFSALFNFSFVSRCGLLEKDDISKIYQKVHRYFVFTQTETKVILWNRASRNSTCAHTPCCKPLISRARVMARWRTSCWNVGKVKFTKHGPSSRKMWWKISSNF